MKTRRERIRMTENGKNGGKREREVIFICKDCSRLKNNRISSHFERNNNTSYNMCFKSGLTFRTSLSVLVLLGMHLASLVPYSEGFNLDTVKALRFDGPNSKSYFGFTVEMMNKDSRNKWILFGAPKDGNGNLPGASSPGAIYKTQFHEFGSGHTFDQIYIDGEIGRDTVDFNGSIKTFEHGRDHQWLGASLDVNENQGVVTCASRWYNRYFETDSLIFMNGLCYLVPLDFNRNNIKKIPALIDRSKQAAGENKWVYGMGCMGSSAHYTKSGNDVLLGAPGLWTWTGGFIDIRQNKSYITQYDEAPTDLNEMAGYAMSSGIYFNDGVTYFAIGAPRQDLVGAVFLISSLRTSLRLPEADSFIYGTTDTGIPMPVNSYFGAALCTVDVNNDKIDDLLVGAPMYSQHSTKDTVFTEEGAVFVFLGGDKRFDKEPIVLRGAQESMARFGSVISSIGDLNKDQFNDIVIGAPYENDNEGAIYIYNGCKTGIFQIFSQRIPGAAVFPGIKSFGAALSKSYNMNDDNVNDITVGAYLSDKAFLLYGQPVINVDFSIKPDVTIIDKDKSENCSTILGGKVKIYPCFKLQVCAYYLASDFTYVEASITTMIDTLKEDFIRVTFETTKTNKITESIRIWSGEEKCTRDWNIYIMSTFDLVTPVIINAKLHDWRIESSTDIKPTLNTFDGNMPDQPLLNKKAKLDFKKDCPNNTCNTDLHLAVEPIYASQDDFFLLGTSVLDVDITITKTGNPSYGSNLIVIVQKDVQYRDVKKLFGDDEVSCDPVEVGVSEGDDAPKESETDTDLGYRITSIPEISENERLISCSYGNPMRSDSGVKFRLMLAVPDLMHTTSLPFLIYTTTLSTELKPDDNRKNFTIEARNKITTEFKGVSRPSFVTVKKEESRYNAEHVLELKNNGPSILPDAYLTIRYPQVQSGGQAHVFLNKTTWSCRHPCKITCAFPDTELISPEVHAGEKGPTYYVNESPSIDRTGEAVQLSDIRHTDCSTSICSRYECRLQNILARESAVVSLDFAINKALLVATGGQTVTIKTDSHIRFGELSRILTNKTEHSLSIFTDIQPKSPPPKPVAWWIILVSVLAGLILIAVIVLILWKCGFFVRKQKDEMEKRMQHEGKVLLVDEDDDIPTKK